MASAAEQLAANFNFSNLGKAKELRDRIFFTLGMLIIARLGTYIPMPGINPSAMAHLISQQQGGLLDMFNMLSGGAVQRMAIFALGIMPYISSSIIVQLMQTVIPELEALKKEGEVGRKQINQYTRYGTVFLAALQSIGIAFGLEQMGQGIVIDPGPFFLFTTVITLTGGTILLMWMGEQVTSRGVGNGISLIIFVGIVARFPTQITQLFEAGRTGSISPFVIFLIFAGAIILVGFIVFIERAQRRLLVQYPKRQVGNRMFGGESSHLPLKLNVSGVIPPIFASSILTVPLTYAAFAGANTPDWMQTMVAYIGPQQPLYFVLYGGMIMFFAFFYTSIVFNPEETAENLKKYGGFIPGIRPGKKTAEYIDYVLTRTTCVGAVYLAVVCLIPEFLRRDVTSILSLGGTSILIIVSVMMDTIAQIQSHLIAQQYEGLIKKAKLRGARR
ncbi:MAG TPA: preprotein translocase subunit SecY [Rhizomicrobium sp.]|nr:preprotein translocase subunit SecY [Rhizomicrobium sp.]